ncbi:MAG: Methyl-accepting chemotaxis protein [Hyphomicrobiales bacterium]|nr:Methyl-accepting chemotaxis protein [Hyphomicrobiales bacterium]
MTLAKAPGTAQQAIDLLFDAKSTLQPFREAAANADARLMPLIERNQNSQKLALSFARMTLITSSMLALAMAVVAGLWLSRTIARPVRLMTVAMNELAGGHLEVEIPAPIELTSWEPWPLH